MVFVDTSVWFPGLVSEDSQHERCRALLKRHAGQLITTDYVVDEVLTLLGARGHARIAIESGRDFWDATAAKLIRVTDDDLRVAWGVFQRHAEQRWSFTDCTSYAVMRRLGVPRALALDDHFHQFGFAEVAP